MCLIGYERLKFLNDRNKTIIKVREFKKEQCNIYKICEQEGYYYLYYPNCKDGDLKFRIFDIGTLLNVLNENLTYYKTYIKNLSALCEKDTYVLTHLNLYAQDWQQMKKVLVKRYTDINFNTSLDSLEIRKVDNMETFISKLILLGGQILLERQYRYCIVVLKDIISIVSEYTFVLTEATGMFLDGLSYKNIYIDNIAIPYVMNFNIDNILTGCFYENKTIKAAY